LAFASNQEDSAVSLPGCASLAAGEAADKLSVISFEDVSLDTNHLRLTGSIGSVTLTIREYRLLLALLQNPGWAISRHTAAKVVWEHDNSYEASDTYRKYGERLSKALNKAGSRLRVVSRRESFLLTNIG
jgi:DNA-binding response OmpR family regulator